MTVDVRAKVFCNLGTVIQGNLADEALSAGQGLISCRGQVVLDGLSTPAVGSTVNFGWERSGTIARIPRTLRVLSSFADPFRGTTTVQLGDKLVYLANLRGAKAEEEEPDGTNGPDPANYPSSDYDYNAADSCYLPKEGAKPFNFSTPDAASKLTVREEYALAPANVMGRAPMGIYASSVLSKCCSALGLAYTGQPLTNVFQDDFDLSAGYVQVIDQLLSSESLFGYLTENETLQIVTIDGYGSGPLITTDELIDLRGINQGILPGQTVSVTFDYKRLNATAADEAQAELDAEEAAEAAGDQAALDALDELARQRNWEEDISVTYNQEYIFTVEEDGATVYSATFSHNPTTTTTTTYDESNYATLRRSVEKRIVASEVGTILQAVINAKFEAGEIGGAQTGANDTILRQSAQSELEFITEETFEYEEIKEEATNEPQALPPDKLCPDPSGTERVVDEDANKPKPVEKRQIKTTVTRYEPLCSLLAKMNVSGYDFSTYDLGNLPTAPYITEQTITYYDTNQPTGQTKTRVDRYLAHAITLEGQQWVAEKGTNVTTDNQLNQLLERGSQLVFSHTEVSIQRDRTFGVQQRPTKEQLQADDKEKDLPVGGGNDKGDQQVDLEQESSSVEASPKLQVEMPLASDDAVVWTASNGYEFKGSNAAGLALQYARTINAILLGNRSGVSLQLAARGMPLYPLSVIYLQAGGLTASYKSNGMSWSFNSDGVLCAMDALYVSGISGTGTRWFPVAPGITTLPSDPTVSTNSAAPANSTTTPSGFNPAAPGSIFNSLPTGQAPIYAQSIAPSSGVPVVIETLPVVAGTRSIVSVLDRDYALTLPTGTAVLVTKAEVTAATHLAAAAGAVMLSGQVAGRTYIRRVQAAAGSFASTGYSAGSVRTYGIGTNAGTLAFSGQSAILPYQRLPLLAANGELQLIGNSSLPRIRINLLAGFGTAALDGQFAQLTSQRMVSAAPGVHELTGNAAALKNVDPFAASVVLLLHMNGTNGSTTFVDSSGGGKTPATATAVISTSTYKYGGASGYFNGSTRIGYADSAAWSLGSSDFTIESWLYLSPLTSTAPIVAQRFSSSSNIGFAFVYDSSVLYFIYSVNGTTQKFVDRAFAPAANQWYHVAVCRSGSSIRLFVDGSQLGATTTTTDVIYDSSEQLSIGALRSGSSSYAYHTGYMDDVRLTKAARYTSNFTPPVAELPDP